jgi:hypothetical protein
MNHIINLQNKNAELTKQLAGLNHEISLFMVYLNSSKFHGGANGSTSIQAEEVYIRMRELRMMTLPNNLLHEN